MLTDVKEWLEILPTQSRFGYGCGVFVQGSEGSEGYGGGEAIGKGESTGTGTGGCFKGFGNETTI